MLHGRLLPWDGGARIGVSVRDLEPSEADSAHGEGVAIDEVEPDGPAAMAGLRRSDIVVAFDGERVRSARQFERLVAETPPDRRVKATVIRDDRRQELEITPQKREALTFNLDMNRLRDELGDLGRYADRIPPLNFDFQTSGALAGRTRLGITTTELGDQLAAYFGAADGGVLVAAVRDDAPASRAGLRAGDVITSVNGEKVRSRAELVGALVRAGDQENVTLGVLRDRKAITVTVTRGA